MITGWNHVTVSRAEARVSPVSGVPFVMTELRDESGDRLWANVVIIEMTRHIWRPVAEILLGHDLWNMVNVDNFRSTSQLQTLSKIFADLWPAGEALVHVRERTYRNRVFAEVMSWRSMRAGYR